jgi:hypothetical protein
MRIWFSGPRILGGLIRPGISLGKEDLRAARRAPVMSVNAVLGLFRRKDGAILMAIGDKTILFVLLAQQIAKNLAD